MCELALAAGWLVAQNKDFSILRASSIIALELEEFEVGSAVPRLLLSCF